VKREEPDRPEDLLSALYRLRWLLAGSIGVIFALMRFVETLVLGAATGTPLANTLDPFLWGGLAAIAIWFVLSWVASQERRFRRTEQSMLAELRRSNARLELLYELNQRVASSATLDDVLDYAIGLPNRLIGAQAAAIVLNDGQGGALTARSVGFHPDGPGRTRNRFARQHAAQMRDRPFLCDSEDRRSDLAACVFIPIAERDSAAIGWIEAYLEQSQREAIGAPDGTLQVETEALLVTVAGELAEAVQGSRRRAREIASVVALEQAVTTERTRIARDLHDGIAQSLAFIRMRVDLWDDWIEQDPQRLHQEFSDLKQTLRRQIEELRQAIYALRPIEIAQLGFVAALRQFVNEFGEQHEWDLDLDLDSLPPDLPHALELAAFRIVQEALNNAAKHAQATRIAVTLRTTDGGLQIIVRDNGIGFDPGTTTNGNKSLGLRQMSERAAALDGRLTIISRPEAGTELRVWLPLIYARERDAGATEADRIA
jgi:signal transduction histidine kinase